MAARYNSPNRRTITDKAIHSMARLAARAPSLQVQPAKCNAPGAQIEQVPAARTATKKIRLSALIN
jgi:hypothetical protein